MRSPEYVQMSTAAAITLGVAGGYMHRTSCTRCLNLLLTYPEGCRANCAYCGLARHREAERNYADRNFIRVDWPAVPYDQVIDIVASGGDGGRFHRMCISMITHPRSDADTRVVLKKWVERIRHVRVIGAVPLGRWETITFVAALRHNKMVGPDGGRRCHDRRDVPRLCRKLLGSDAPTQRHRRDG